MELNDTTTTGLATIVTTTNQRERLTMKFMVTWTLHPGKVHDAIAQLSRMTLKQEMSGLAAPVKLLGRWHRLVQGTGWQFVRRTVRRRFPTGC